MLPEISIEQCRGKTLKGHSFSPCNGSVILVFDDGTFTTLGIEWQDEIDQAELELFNFGDAELIAMGIISRDELEAHRAERNGQNNARQAELELQTYKRLKKRFDP